MINFIKGLFGKSLKSKVMKVIERKINEVEKELNKELKQLKNIRRVEADKVIATFMSEAKALKTKYNSDVSETTQKHLNSILSKIL